MCHGRWKGFKVFMQRFSIYGFPVFTECDACLQLCFPLRVALSELIEQECVIYPNNKHALK